MIKINEFSVFFKKNKSKIMQFIIFFAISFVIVLPNLLSFAVINDMPFHLNRIQSLAASLKSGNFYPIIYGSALNNYGYANGVFYPQLFLYIPAILVCLGARVTTAYSIFVIILNITTSYISYYSCKYFLTTVSKKIKSSSLVKKLSTKDIQKISMIFAVFYTCGFYRILNYIKSSLGELIALTFFPIVVVGIFEIFLPVMLKNNNQDNSNLEDTKYLEKTKWWILTLGMSLLLNCHILSVFIASTIIGIIAIINLKNIKTFFKPLLNATLSTALLNAYVLFPLIEQMTSNTFYFNIKNSVGSLSSNSLHVLFVKISPILLILLDTFFFVYFMHKIHKEKNNETKLEKIIKSTIYLFIIFSSNLFPWTLLNEKPIIKTLQFPWRIYLIATTLICFVYCIYTYKHIKKKHRLSAIVLISAYLLTSTSLFIFNRFSTNNSRSDYIPSTCEIGNGEYLPIKYSGDIKINTNGENDESNVKNIATKDRYKKENNNKVVILTDSNNPSDSNSNKIKIKYNYKKKENNIDLKYTITSNVSSNSANQESLKLELPVIYYKGYTAKIVEGTKDANIEINESPNGLIMLTIDNDTKTGKSVRINVKYSYTPIQIISFIISASSIICATYMFFKKLPLMLNKMRQSKNENI